MPRRRPGLMAGVWVYTSFLRCALTVSFVDNSAYLITDNGDIRRHGSQHLYWLQCDRLDSMALLCSLHWYCYCLGIHSKDRLLPLLSMIAYRNARSSTPSLHPDISSPTSTETTSSSSPQPTSGCVSPSRLFSPSLHDTSPKHGSSASRQTISILSGGLESTSPTATSPSPRTPGPGSARGSCLTPSSARRRGRRGGRPCIRGGRPVRTAC